MAKAILDAIEQLEIYTTNKVQQWKEIMQRPSNSEEQDRVATAVWGTYRDMANRIADLGELVEEVLNSEGYMNGMYEELLEKLRKNNRMSGWTHIDRLMDEAAEAIETLQQENKQLKKERDQAIRDIDKNCRSCVYDGKKICYGNMLGKDREVAKEQGLPYCMGWQWRGLEGRE